MWHVFQLVCLWFVVLREQSGTFSLVSAWALLRLPSSIYDFRCSLITLIFYMLTTLQNCAWSLWYFCRVNVFLEGAEAVRAEIESRHLWNSTARTLLLLKHSLYFIQKVQFYASIAVCLFFFKVVANFSLVKVFWTSHSIEVPQLLCLVYL